MVPIGKIGGKCGQTGIRVQRGQAPGEVALSVVEAEEARARSLVTAAEHAADATDDI
jgi:hypothetical protein